jgi:ferredoxin
LIGVEAGAENSFNSCMEMDMGAIKHNTGTCKHGAGHSIGDEKQDEADSSIEGKLLELSADENILFDKVDWDRISETCIGCGTCTYICPTCHCFDFKDVAEKGVASRYRCWDSCMYPKFTLHTSGHNPRPTKTERYRQRIMHKYVYVKKNFGYIACTGCGRCVRSCPAGVNIKSVVKRIMEEMM